MPGQTEHNDGGRDKMKPKTTNQTKKPYRSPRLVVYGDLRRLTTAKGGPNVDSGGGPKSKSTTGSA